MDRKSYYKEGVYIDTTTGREYIPKDRCEICKASFGLTVHHYIYQQLCMRDLKAKKTRTPKTLTQEFINDNQKLFTLCTNTCHQDVHSLSEERFFQRYGLDKKEFVYSE